ncbi:MAG: PQQ-binding-like beta-propeller repeat protein [Planctomycetota bacterium]
MAHRISWSWRMLERLFSRTAGVSPAYSDKCGVSWARGRRDACGTVVVALVCSLICDISAANVPEPVKEPKPEAAEKNKNEPKGPEHNVSLVEESGVLDLLNKAQKARERAEKDPQVWPECLKHYAEILRKYSHTVYLDRWEGDNKEQAGQYKNGLYKSTRERVMRDIASLPPAGLAIYRVINDSVARSLFVEAQEQFNERKMEQVALDYFSTSWGDDALVWLAEVSYNRGATRQAISRLLQMTHHPNKDIPKTAVLTRLLLAQIQANDRTAAENTLRLCGERLHLLEVGANDGLRVGHDEGQAAFDKLKKRVAGMTASIVNAQVSDGHSWETYFVNAAHNQVLPARRNIGLLHWSIPIIHLLYGPNVELLENDNNAGNLQRPEIQNYHIAATEGCFYLCDSRVIAAYPGNNPKPGRFGSGNAKFLWPGEIEYPKLDTPRGHGYLDRFPAMTRHHPYFVTLSAEQLYAVCGADPMSIDANAIRWRNNQGQKQQPNYLVALSRQSGKLFWSLQPDSAAFQNHSKADQEWLRSVYFISAPTYETGRLYVMAYTVDGSNIVWGAAFDAETGHLEWHTQICSAQPSLLNGSLTQPDIGLPVAVAQGKVFVLTNLGAVAVLDTINGAIQWIRVYDRIPNQIDRDSSFDMRRQSRNIWSPNPPIVQNNILIITPQDSDMLYIYDIETGRRLWEISRDSNGEQLTHILGITNGHLAISGKNLYFYEIKSGKQSGQNESLTLGSNIKGRGIVTENMALVPTEKALVRIDTQVLDGKFTVQIRDTYKWENPAAEAGNIFVVGDVLYTVSSTHVNAYFDSQELERKLRERIVRNTNDLSAYIELSDVYHRITRYTDALIELDNGLAIAAKLKDDPKVVTAINDMQTRKFDALCALGEVSRKSSKGAQPDFAAASEYYKKALAVALRPDLQPSLPVIALHAMAAIDVARAALDTAVGYYQQIIAQHGEAIFAQQRSASQARLFAQAQIDALKRQNPKSYEKIEAEAQTAFQNAGDDIKKLETVLCLYPNADACGSALLKLAKNSFEANSDLARQYCQRFLRSFGGSPEAPSVTALLIVALEREKRLSDAKDLLRRLITQKELGDKNFTFNPLNPKDKTVPVGTLADWAQNRLVEPQFQCATSSAIWSLGNGKLKLAWQKSASAQRRALNIQGTPPMNQRGNIFFLENQDLVVLSSTEKGEEVWTPRPKTPTTCSAQAVWANHLLILWGNTELAAYDSNEKGKVVWRRHHLSGASVAPQSVWANEQRVVVAYPNGVLETLDADSGAKLWRAQLEGNRFQSALVCGESFVAVASANPPKLHIYELDTGALRHISDVDGGANFKLELCAVGDYVYYAKRGNIVCAVDGNNGKLLWEYQLDGPATRLYPTHEFLIAVINQRQIVVLNTQPQAKRLAWTPQLPLGATVRELCVDGDDLYVVINTQKQSIVQAFSISSQGKFQWQVGISSEFNSISLATNTLATGHLVVTQANWDPTGAKSSAVVLVDRKTGKLITDITLSSEIRPQNMLDDTPQSSFTAQLFEGGLVITELRKHSAYLAVDATVRHVNLADLQAKLKKNPKDANLRIKFASALFDKGEHENAIGELVAALTEGGLSDEKFSAVYEEFARLRKEYALKAKPLFTFKKMIRAPKLDGNLTDWADLSEKTLDNWRDVFLASEDDVRPGHKKPLWKGPADLKVSFRGGYDDKNLYLLFVVTDDIQKNEQTKSAHCDFGDSVKIVFDVDRDGGMGYRGQDFEIGISANQAGDTVFHRWVERGKYIGDNTPLPATVFVVRKEAAKQTIYQLALPLDYLQLKSEAGRKFGFSFMVNDQDTGTAVEKAIGVSPGVGNSPYPGMFGEGLLDR